MKISSISTIKVADALHPRHSEASIIFLQNGNMLLAWSRFSSFRNSTQGKVDGSTMSNNRSDSLDSDNDFAEIALMESADRGNSWESERVIQNDNGGLNTMSPAFCRLQDGGIGLAYSRRHALDKAEKVFRTSYDEGKTWSDPFPMSCGGYVTGCNDRLLLTSNGRLIYPAHTTDSWESHYLRTRLLLSDDNGNSWYDGLEFSLPKHPSAHESGAWEASVTEYKRGKLKIIFRTAEGCFYTAESADNGEKWSNLEPMSIRTPISPGCIYTIPKSSHMVLIWNDHYNQVEPMFGYRTHLTLAISNDLGKTWPFDKRTLLLHSSGKTYGYPSCIHDSGELFITAYEADRKDPFGMRSLLLIKVDISN